MKKIIASAVGLALVGGVAVTTASAVESQFGGYWRTRMFAQSDFSGADNPDYNRTDNRTRLYYTAKFNDEFKFVNRFEFNSNWGDDNGGDIGSDGDTFRVKHSYADFTLGNVHTSIGQQGRTLSRGFLFADDFSGAVITPTFGSFSLPVTYFLAVDDDVRQPGYDGGDVHFVHAAPTFTLDNWTLTPSLAYLNETGVDNNMAWIGLDVDAKFDSFSAWGTAIFNTGEYEDLDTGANGDAEGFLVGAGAEAGIFHGQAFYATGDDDDADGDVDTFIGAPGQSYYWSEIMGYGIFDNQASAGAPGDKISNIMAVNLGVTLKPMEKMKLDFDVWYAALAEDNINGDDALGVEFDAKLTYALMDDLNAEFVFAYLMADDATVTAPETSNDEDAIEAGVRLSLKF